MNSRLSYPYVWAVDGVVSDPDLDTTAPSFKPDRYESIGWEVEKPPEEWQNFLLQISDVKVVELLVSGILQWDSSVAYPVGAIASVDGVLYAKVGDSLNTLSPNSVDSGWLVASAMQVEDYEELLAWIEAHLHDHMLTHNPHQDNMAGLVGGGYEKEETLKFFLDDKDPRTIGYHKLQKGASVHGTTCEQLNILPKSGGTFTELITFLGCILLAGGSKLCFNNSTARLELSLGQSLLSIDTNGDAWVTKGGVTSWVMTIANYPEMQIRSGFMFALPQCVSSVDFRTSINDLTGLGWDTVSTQTEPVFSGGLVLSNQNATINFEVYQNVTIWMKLVVGGSVKCFTKDATEIHPRASLLSWIEWIGGTGATHFLQMVVYPRLSLYQKSMLEK